MPLPLYAKKKEVHPLSKIKYIVGVAAGKGGVGKSTLTVNLALALQSKGFKVGIMDTDLYGPSIRRMLPEDQLPSQNDTSISPALCSGIKMISMAYFRKEGEATVVRAPIANNLIAQFIKNVNWGVLDYLLIDFPPGTGDIQLTLCQQALLTAALLVTTPQEVAIMDVRKALHMFNQVKVPILGIIENMSYYKNPQTQELINIFGQGGGERLSRESKVPFLGKIPLDSQLCQSGDQGISLFSSQPLGETAEIFLHLASLVVEHLEKLKQENEFSLENYDIAWKQMDEE